MKVTLTIKLTAESKGELIDTFGAQTREFKEILEHVVAEHGFAGIPAADVTLRWLFEPGVWA